MVKKCHFWVKHERRYRYHEWVPVPMVHFGTEEKWYRYHSNGTGTQPTVRNWYWYQQSGTGTTASYNLKLAYFCTVKSCIHTRLFRNPKKQLMGVQIEIKLSEKRIVPHRLGEFVFGQT